MRGTWRWWLVLSILIASVLGYRVAAHRSPAPSALSPQQRLALIQHASSAPYSGYVETTGTLPLPSSSGLSEVTNLLAGPSRLRVWWRDDSHWRVSRLTNTNETDTVRTGKRLVTWSYDDRAVERGIDRPLRLPRSGDLLPPNLARQALSQVSLDELSVLPSQLIAGRGAVGIRVRPTTGFSSIERVDIWADATTGIALRVAFYGRDSTPIFTTEFKQLDPTDPAPADLEFVVPAGASVDKPALDLVDGASRYSPYQFPDTLLGLPRTSAHQRGVAIYARGATWLLIMPMQDRVAHPLLDQLEKSRDGSDTAKGRLALFGPLTVFVTYGDELEGHIMITGTVTTQGLDALLSQDFATPRYTLVEAPRP